MGLMTDGLHDSIKTMTDIMVAVAKGEISTETLGRWVATYHPERKKDLPHHLQDNLSVKEVISLRALAPHSE